MAKKKNTSKNGKKTANRPTKGNNQKKQQKSANSGKPGNVGKSGRKKLQTSRTKIKYPAQAGRFLQHRTLALSDATRNGRIDDFKRKYIKNGRLLGLPAKFTDEALEEAEYQIKKGFIPNGKKIKAFIQGKYLRYSDTSYQQPADSIKSTIRNPIYINKKIKTIDFWGNIFETAFNEIAVEITEDSNSFFWMVVDEIRKKGTLKSPVFLPFILERKQLMNREKHKIPRVLRIDFSKNESISGVNIEKWKAAKEIVRKEIK